MASRRTLYLANPYGFSAGLARGLLQDLARALEELGAVVWEPFSNVDHDDPDAPQWAWRIGQANVNAVRQADGIFAVVNSCPPDEGVMVEVGLAISWRKPVFLFRDDFRRCSDTDAYPLNLMVFAGYPADSCGPSGTSGSRIWRIRRRAWRAGSPATRSRLSRRRRRLRWCNWRPSRRQRGTPRWLEGGAVVWRR